MHISTLLLALSTTASAGIVRRANWVSGPFALQIHSNDTRYDMQYLSPQALSSTVGIGSASSVPSYYFYYLERTGQLFTATNFLSSDPAVRDAQPGEYSDKVETLSWSYEVSHNDPAKPDVVSHKKSVMDTIFFAFESNTIEERAKERWGTFVSFDIRKKMVREEGDEEVFYMCDKTTVDGFEGTYTALSLLQADEERDDCAEITLKAINLPKKLQQR